MIKTHAPSLYSALHYGLTGTARKMLKAAFGLTLDSDLDEKLSSLTDADIPVLKAVDRQIKSLTL